MARGMEMVRARARVRAFIFVVVLKSLCDLQCGWLLDKSLVCFDDAVCLEGCSVRMELFKRGNVLQERDKRERYITMYRNFKLEGEGRPSG